MTSTKSLFVYQWLIEDISGFTSTGKEERVVNVQSYCVDVDSNNVLLKAFDGEFSPWLALELSPHHSESQMLHHVSSLVNQEEMNPRILGMNENNNEVGIYIKRTDIEKKLYFYQDKKVKVYHIFFPSIEARKQFYFQIKYKNKRSNAYKVHGYETTPTLQFLSSLRLPSVGWIECSSDIFSQPIVPKITRSSSEFNFTIDQIRNKENQEEYQIPVFRTLAFDLECYSAIPSKFPDAKLKTDLIFQIGVSTLDEKNQEEKHIFTMSKKNFQMDNLAISVHTFTSEKQLLLSFLDFILEFNPIVLLGYNVYGFDITYLKTRCEMYNIDIERRGMSIDRKAPYKELKWSSSAYSVQQFYLYQFDGRIIVDLLVIVKRNYKLSNYKLSTVSSYFLGDDITKDPMTVKDIFDAYSLGFHQKNMPKLVKCSKYCVQDANLCLLLYKKLCILFELIEMARLVSVQMDDLMLRGQQFKVYSMVYRKCYNEKRLVDSFDSLSDKEKEFLDFEQYQGAFVFDPIVGRHSMILPFDFSSLYPSCLISYNICYSTLIPKEKVKNIQKDDYHAISWEDENKNNFCYHYSKKTTGVIPSLLQDLLQQRNVTKKLLKHTKDGFLANILDKRQLAYKLSANSVYGALGVNVGYLPNKVSAMSCTAMGRQSIQKAAAFVKKELNGKIIYGDSVAAHTPIYICDEQEDIKIYTIEDFWNLHDDRKLPYPQFKLDDQTLQNKEQILMLNLKNSVNIFSSDGLTLMKRLIRHRCNKKMYKVYTTSGSVICTEDHSLLLKRHKTEIKPQHLTVHEDELLTICDENRSYMVDKLVYQKEKWNTIHSQKNGFVHFSPEVEDKYIGYYFFTYKKKFPDCVFDFIRHDSGKIEYVIDLKNRKKRRSGLVLKVEEYSHNHNEFVYDIETSVGNFHCSNGELIVKNTDSIYVHFDGINDCRKLWKFALQVEKLIQDAKLFGSHMKLCFEEKIYVSMLTIY